MHVSKASRSSYGSSVFQVVGFGCLLAWTDVTFFSRLVHYSTRNDITHLNSTYAFACCGIIAALLFGALPWQRIARALGIDVPDQPRAFTPRRLRVLSWSVACVLTLCTVTLLLVERRFFTQPWCSIASTVAGLAVGGLFLGWASVFTDSRDDGRTLVLRIAASFCAGAALFVAMLHLPDALAMFVVCVLPPVSVGCLCSSRPYAGDVCDESGRPASSDTLNVETRAVIFRAFASFALLGFAESLVRAIFLDVDPVSNGVTYRWLFLTATLLAAAAVVAANAFGVRTNTARTLNRVCLFVMVTLTMLAPIVYGCGMWSDLPAMVCFCLLYLFLWTSLAQTARAYRIAASRLFGYGLGAAYIGCLAGTFLGSVLMSFLAMGWRGTSTSAFISAVLVLVALLFVADDRTMTVLIDADDERPQAPRRFRLRIEDVAATYGLTAKETEVLTLAAKGRTNQRIREELGISAGTVNTHLMHIYKKLDVHDRQQMLDMLDGRDPDTP